MHSLTVPRAVGTALIFAITATQGELPRPVAPNTIKVGSVTIEQGSLPGGKRPWIKLVANFESSPRWIDGVAFSFTALLGVNNQYRVVNGVVRYANIRSGPNRAVMYLSPNTVERFGPPLAVRVKAFKEEESDTAEFTTPGNYPPDWERRFDKYPGLLLSVIQTPWLTIDYSASPDIFATQ